MNTSICIVSKNRKKALRKTLTVLRDLIDSDNQEVLVFLDGCDDGSNKLLQEFPNVQWFESSRSIGASPARRVIFAQARGAVIFGFDDDAHPLQLDFVEKTQRLFTENLNVGVLAFEEIKGIFPGNQDALQLHQSGLKYKSNSFVGCGFAIRRAVYEETAGFPEWMDIYGEEGCLSVEIIDKGYDILYTSAVSVNHRVDRNQRKLSGSNTFRFERQLCNMGLYFIVFYPANLLPRKLAKLLWHNLKRYALTDFQFFKAYFRGIFRFFMKFSKALAHRSPVSKNTVKKVNKLPHPKYG